MRKKIVYLPLDERPCNSLIPEMIVKPQKDKVLLLQPPKKLLGEKKREANTEKLHQWLIEEAVNADAMVLSIEMLVYGGLLPSRLHQMELEEGKAKLALLKELKTQYPAVKIYASNLIMRTPKYSSDDEEPTYYGIYGSSIFRRAYLLDKKERVGLTKSEAAELEEIINSVPEKYLLDYEKRRSFNQEITEAVLSYVKQGIIDYLVIPQDDSAEFGYTAKDQKKVRALLVKEDLEFNVAIYPGADEVGATLIARAYCEMFDFRPSFFPVFPSVYSETIIPMYEDRPLGESMKSHISAVGGKLAFSSEKSDIILGYNTAGNVMQEAWDQIELQDITYLTHRNLQTFIEQLVELHAEGKPIAIADSAYANGGDISLIKGLDKVGLLEELLSYKGWNTNCNTLGTTLAAAILAYNSEKQNEVKENIIYHLLDDVCYQSIARNKVTKLVLPEFEANYFDISQNEREILATIERVVLEAYHTYCRNSFKKLQFEKITSSSPWHRMFEIEYSIDFHEE